MEKSPKLLQKLNIKKNTVLLLFLLSAAFSCKDSKKTSADTEKQPDPASKEESVYRPVSKEECQNIQAKLEKALNTKFQITLEKASDFPKGSGCYLEAQGTGVHFDMGKTPEAVEKAIAWETDNRYAAGGPKAIQGGLRNRKKVIVYGVNLKEPLDAGCSGRPDENCITKPEKQIYTVSAWIGQQD